MTEPIGSKPITDLLEEVLKISEMQLTDDSVKELKHKMRTNPMRQALHEVLCNEQEKIAFSTRKIKEEIPKPEDTERLDNMLRARGVIGPDISYALASEVVGSERNEYREKLMKVRKCYEDQIAECDKQRDEFATNVRSVLRLHSEFRPISENSIENMVNNLSGRFKKIPLQLKQSACEAVVNLQKRFCDARRKRKNFAKSSTEILNEYFHANINYPYPSEEVKHALAVQCNMSVAQVSNWFGNKRIRYKKAIAKEQSSQKDAKNNVAVAAAAAAAAAMTANPFLMPNAFMNPYQMMMQGNPQFALGMAPINFPVYNPEMMAQYQQTIQNTQAR